MSSLTPRLDKLDKNYIINGNFDFWQRNTSFTSTQNVDGWGSEIFVADRYKSNMYRNGFNLSLTTSRQTDVPSPEFSYSLRATVNGSYALGATATTIIPIMQSIEGTSVSDLTNASTIYLSFWIKSNVSGTLSFSLQKWTPPAIDGSYLFTETVVANTWKKVIKAIQLPGSAVNKGNNMSFRLTLGAIGGSSSFYGTGSLNQWVSGDYHFATTATNWAATSGNWIQLAGLKMSDNNSEEFCRAGRNYAEELQLCQRYYEKSYPLSAIPNSVTADGGIIKASSGDSGGNHYFSTEFKVRKRALPTCTVYLPGGGINTLSAFTNNTTQSGHNFNGPASVNISLAAEYGFYAYAFSYSSYGNGRIFYHFTADAEL